MKTTWELSGPGHAPVCAIPLYLVEKFATAEQMEEYERLRIRVRIGSGIFDAVRILTALLEPVLEELGTSIKEKTGKPPTWRWYRGRRKKETVPVLTCEELVSVGFAGGFEKVMLQEAATMQRAWLGFLPYVEAVSRLSGRKIIMHLVPPDEPSQLDKEAMHFNLSGDAPNDPWRKDEAHSAYGILFHRRGKPEKITTYRRGRGYLVYDTKKQPVLQCWRGVVQTLIPLVSIYRGKPTRRLFGRVLMDAWNVWSKRGFRIRPLEENEETQDSFVKWVREFLTTGERSREEYMKAIDDRIQYHQQELQQAYVMKRTGLIELERFRVSTQVVENRFGEVMEDITALPTLDGVARVYFCDSGVHIETKPIVAEWESKHYPLGTFNIRISAAGIVSVWGLETTHPKGVPHPHLSDSGAACYGSATDAILRAANEYKFTKCVTLIVRWLVDGYTPESARNKIEEWPATEVTA